MKTNSPVVHRQLQLLEVVDHHHDKDHWPYEPLARTTSHLDIEQEKTYGVGTLLVEIQHSLNHVPHCKVYQLEERDSYVFYHFQFQQQQLHLSQKR